MFTVKHEGIYANWVNQFAPSAQEGSYEPFEGPLAI